jgi:hypothetical protein
LLGQEPLVEHVIRWEVVSPITAAPRRIVLSTEKPEFHFALSAVDRATFRVDRIEAPPGMIASLVHKGPPLYRIRVTWDGTTPLGKGNAMLRVQTDHPSQPEFQIPITLLD